MYIKREDAITVIDNISKLGGFKNFSAYCSCYNAIIELPSAIKLAYWIKQNDTFQCSNCKSHINEFQYKCGAHNYCPSCGARMEEEDINKKCSGYHIEYGVPRCWGTKEKEECNCKGNKIQCNFYNLT